VEATGTLEANVRVHRVVGAWWPLAASWLLMGVELPMVGAIVARLADPEIHLAAYGGVVFPIALVIEAPIIMLLTASTQLCRDAASYAGLRRFMMRANVALTLLHVLVAFTPLYDVTVVRIMNVPPDVVEPARIGLMIMTPWTAAIGYRRFQQGVLIRFGFSGAVWYGTAIRLAVNATTLVVGFVHGGLAGIVVATTAVSAGVLADAVYAGIRVRPVVREHLSRVDPGHKPLVGRAFVNFYVPLAMTPLIALVVQPVGAAAISRMPEALASLAVWPVMSGLVFIFQTFGMAFSEVVVALFDEPGARRVLWRFTLLLTFVSTVLLLAVALTPLAALWFGEVSGLSPELTVMAASTVWITLPMPGSRALQSWYQGVLVGAQRTGPITESVLVFLVVCSAILWWGARWATTSGLYVALWAFSIARVVQTVWLWRRSRAEARASPA